MNILDFQDTFKVEFEFIGDNECDRNLMTITRKPYDANGHEVCTEESYCLRSDALADIKMGLEIFLQKLNDYIKEGV